ncbi:hypothetical protein D3C86_71650 [compost metagenome]
MGWSFERERIELMTILVKLAVVQDSGACPGFFCVGFAGHHPECLGRCDRIQYRTNTGLCSQPVTDGVESIAEVAGLPFVGDKPKMRGGGADRI